MYMDIIEKLNLKYYTVKYYLAKQRSKNTLKEKNVVKYRLWK